MCVPCMGCCRALEYIDIAHEHEPGSIYSHLIAFKVHLEREDAGAACKELAAMMACTDFSPETLSVSRNATIHGQSLYVQVRAINADSQSNA